jgi:hypothetical protein
MKAVSARGSGRTGRSANEVVKRFPLNWGQFRNVALAGSRFPDQAAISLDSDSHPVTQQGAVALRVPKLAPLV